MDPFLALKFSLKITNFFRQIDFWSSFGDFFRHFGGPKESWTNVTTQIESLIVGLGLLAVLVSHALPCGWLPLVQVLDVSVSHHLGQLVVRISEMKPTGLALMYWVPC